MGSSASRPVSMCLMIKSSPITKLTRLANFSSGVLIPYRLTISASLSAMNG